MQHGRPYQGTGGWRRLNILEARTLQRRAKSFKHLQTKNPANPSLSSWLDSGQFVLVSLHQRPSNGAQESSGTAVASSSHPGDSERTFERAVSRWRHGRIHRSGPTDCVSAKGSILAKGSIMINHIFRED